MDQNPYESPKEVSSPPTIKAGVALGTLLLLSIPAGCVCGGVTCFSVGVTGEAASKVLDTRPEAGFIMGIPIGLIVLLLIPALAIRFFGKRKDGGIIRQ